MKDKALIEKAFEKWKNDSGCRNNSCNDCQGGCEGAFIAGATWQREQLDKYKAKDLLDEIHTNYMCYHAKNYDTKDFVINLAGGSVVVMDKQGYQELKKSREQIIQELREWIESNKELRGYTGIPDDTLNIILAKLDLLEKGGE
jgi:uncharacterized membrane protein affecting hemolysin expression